jgi:hypothetical protein
MAVRSAVQTTVPSRIVVSAVAAGPVLARVFGIVGARAGLSLDRVSDLLLVADTIADADVHADGRVSVEFAVAEGRVELLVGPLIDGGAEQLASSPRVAGVPVLPRLADSVSVVGSGPDARVRLVIS